MNTISAQLDPKSLRDLGVALIARAQAAEETNRTSDLELLEDGVERLAEILCRGGRPTIGFWVRYGRRVGATASS